MSRGLLRAATSAMALERARLVGAQCRARGVVIHDPWADYPALLEATFDPPPLLFTRGRGALEDGAPCVALVGSRVASPEGLTFAWQLGAELAEAGVTVVSGLARGVDRAALGGAVAVRGRALAVLGHGLHMIYPSEHLEFAATLSERGLLVSEWPLGMPPRRAHFPRRNRIIAGLSLATVVIEAGLKSGALITADFALECGREVLAGPGSPLNPCCQGSNLLLKQGAALVERADDVLAALAALGGASGSAMGSARDKGSSTLVAAGDRELEQRVLAALGRAWCPSPVLAARLGEDCDRVARCLTALELAGRTRRRGPLWSADRPRG